VWIAGRRSFVISIEITPAGTNPSRPALVPAATTWQGFQIGGLQPVDYKIGHHAVSQTITKVFQSPADHQRKAKPLKVSLRSHGHPGETGNQQRS